MVHLVPSPSLVASVREEDAEEFSGRVAQDADKECDRQDNCRRRLPMFHEHRRIDRRLRLGCGQGGVLHGLVLRLAVHDVKPLNFNNFSEAQSDARSDFCLKVRD